MLMMKREDEEKTTSNKTDLTDLPRYTSFKNIYT